MGFTTTDLTGDRVLVTGVDIRGVTGEVVVDATQWRQIKRHQTKKEAAREVETAIETLLAPIQAAIDSAKSKLELPKIDPLLYYVEQEGSEGVRPTPERTIKLTHDSVILRAIEEGHENRLVWVNNTLELTAAPVTPEPTPEPVNPAVTTPADETDTGDALD